MEDRITFKNMGKKFIDGQIPQQEFIDFFEGFKNGLKNIQDEFKKSVEPMIYNNSDSKKISEKSNVFTSLFDDMSRGIRIIESSLSEEINMEKFQKGYQTILVTADKMESFKKDMSVLANSTPM